MGEAGFSCPKCATSMESVGNGEYRCPACSATLRLVEEHAQASAYAAPTHIQEIEKWFRAYRSRLETLEAQGYYSVPSDLGTKVQSDRAGRPTERVALLFVSLVAQVRAVEMWLNSLSPLERLLVATWLDNRKLTVVAAAAGVEYKTAWGILNGIPLTIWSRFYSGQDSGQQTA